MASLQGSVPKEQLILVTPSTLFSTNISTRFLKLLPRWRRPLRQSFVLTCASQAFQPVQLGERRQKCGLALWLKSPWWGFLLLKHLFYHCFNQLFQSLISVLKGHIFIIQSVAAFNEITSLVNETHRLLHFVSQDFGLWHVG